MRLSLTLCGLITILLAMTAFGDVPSVISYQGILTDPGGTPVPDGSYSVTFAIYDAVSGGTVQWTETKNISTTSGAFSTLLGSVVPIGVVVFDGVDRFLGIKVNADPEMTPRTRLASVPYAFNSGSGWVDDGYIVHLLNSADDMVGIGVDTVAFPWAKLDIASSLYNASVLTYGTRGVHKNTGNGGGAAGYFEYVGASTYGNGYGLIGYSDTYGLGRAYGLSGVALNSSNGGATGGIFDATATGSGSAGARALELSAFATSSNWAFGMTGDIVSEGGPAYGQDLVVTSDSHGATGTRMVVSGKLGTKGLDLNVTSLVASSTYGITSVASSATGALIGIRSQTDNSGSSDATAIEAQAWNSGSGGVTGVYAYAEGNTTSPIFGLRAPDIVNFGNGATYGVYGTVTSGGSGTHYGVYGYETAGGSGAAVYASGDMIASGAKPAVVRTSQGENLMYATEATEIWFEDIGRGQLQNGSAHIELDPLYLETVVIDDQHPLEVFIQLRGDCNGTYVSIGTTGFDVLELQSGSSDASFTYRVMAKRKGYEDERMRPTTVGWMDKQLYPERAAEIDAALGRPVER